MDQPIWHHDMQQLLEILAMIGMNQVAKLVEDYVVNTDARSFDQLWIQQDVSRVGAATPALLHPQQLQLGT